LVADDHYVGIDVHRGARIAAAAHGGQVLVSERTRGLVESGLLRDVGAHRLKDLPGPERLYQLVIDGLPGSFPPPRSQAEALEAAGLPDYSRPPADVPCPYKGLVTFEPDDADVFFGREQLVEDLVRRLDDAAFLAVVGASGSGKSSLVRAGIVPALRRRDSSLRTLLFSPGGRPFAVVGEPGALPLLSHSLLETWKRRSDRMLTLLGYLQAGGVQGAIAQTAETVYREGLTPDQQALARNIFLRLTELGEGTEDTRRRVAIAELTPRAEQRDDVDEVLRTLADARLVTIGEGTVEVAHEALIRHWPTLRA